MEAKEFLSENRNEVISILKKQIEYRALNVSLGQIMTELMEAFNYNYKQTLTSDDAENLEEMIIEFFVEDCEHRACDLIIEKNEIERHKFDEERRKAGFKSAKMY